MFMAVGIFAGYSSAGLQIDKRKVEDKPCGQIRHIPGAVKPSCKATADIGQNAQR